MNIPSQFYYSAAQSSVNYSRTPTGTLVIKELIAGNPCWVAPTLQRDVKRKKLILADWTASTWTPEKIEQVKKTLGEYIDQGFSVYLEGDATPLDKEQLDCLDNVALRKMISRISPQDVTQAAVIHNGMTQDEVQVIDDYWLRHMINDNKELGPRVLWLSELPDLSQEEMDKLVVILKTSTPAVSTIYHDEFSNKSNKLARYLTEHVDGVNIEHDFRNLSLNDTQLLDFLTHGSIGVDGFTFNALQIKKLSWDSFREISHRTAILDLPDSPVSGLIFLIRCKLCNEYTLSANMSGLMDLEDERRLLDETKKINEEIEQIERDLARFSASVQPATSAVNPTHNPNEMKAFKPKSATEPFKFKGENQTKNQGMLIEKLCQYLTREQKHLDVIPKIQDGMCVALSHYFSTMDKAAWDGFINKALAWNGQAKLDDDLAQHFDQLIENVQQYQLYTQPKKHYLGNSLASFLATETPCVLVNPWHAIAIKPAGNGNWHVYDPNYVTGWQEIAAENVLSTLHDAIGEVVAVESDTPMHACMIDNPDDFIAHGGLIALLGCENTGDMLSQLPANHSYSKEALDGLLLRSTSGRPAWLDGLESHNPAIKALTQALKHQFEAMHQGAIHQLTKSMEALTPAQQGECITQLVQQDSTHSKALIEAIRTSANKAQYEQDLKTWDKTAERVSSVLAYCHQCLVSGDSKRLIKLDSTQHVDTLRLHLQQQALSTGRPVFYIDKPDDLICSASWMSKNKDGSGVLCKGSGGALYDFLQANQGKRPLLIVNYERFNADDMVRFNGLLDKNPNADGTVLPENTQIVGLMNRNKPDCYQGSDFYSRFNRTELCPLSRQQLDASKVTRSVDVLAQKGEGTTVINLYHAPDWEERLLGCWVLNGDALTFKEGELIQAINAGKSIEIQNGLWGEPRFERFWQQVLSGGYRHAERVIQLPEHIALVRPEIDAYDWDKLKQAMLVIQNGFAVDEQACVLNPSCLGDFLARYEVDGDKLVKKPGLVEEAKALGKPLTVNVTRTLTDDAWAMLLDECQRQGVQLNAHCGSGVEMPAVFNHQSMPIDASMYLDQDIVITTTDMDTTIDMLLGERTAPYEIIDVSECTAADLLVRLDGKLNKESLRFEFSETEGALKTALASHKNIILKGHFSAELQDALAPILLSRRAGTEPGNQIILMTNESNVCAYASNRRLSVVTQEEKLACLQVDKRITDKLGTALENESLSQLKARCRYLALNPSGNSDDAYIGMNSLSGNTQASTAKLDRTKSAVESVIFTKSRIAKVNGVLESAPYVFLTGLSGVGKSTFVEKEFCKNDALYLTEARIQDWVNDTSDKRKILFLDEANLSTRQWSEFEGLFNKPPTILVNGVLCPLTANHKVVFAGNPVNYGDERKLASFFQRHGNAVLFTPLPPAVIYEKILKPVFAGTDVNQDVISDRILDVYRFVCECSTTEVLISPRELQMMALLTLTHAKQHPEQNIEDIAAHFSHALARNLVPTARQAEFDTKFKPMVELDVTLNTDSQFFITPSRQVLSQQLDDLLNLREWRREPGRILNQTQKGGGLGGIIIEGEPGIGKSELVVAALRAHNYTEEHDFKNPSTAANPFYRMPVSMPLSEKEDLLIKAFNEGAVVMIDEMNSSPMMERLLNDLLMGKNPRNTGDTPAKPGFMVIGTQNPVTMAGRRVASTALQRRVITTVLPEYTPDELKTILLAKGVKAVEVDSMVEVYETNRAFAIKNGLSPVPNFRNLIELADNHLKAQAQVINSENDEKITELQSSDDYEDNLTDLGLTELQSDEKIGVIEETLAPVLQSRPIVSFILRALAAPGHCLMASLNVFNIRLVDIPSLPQIKPPHEANHKQFTVDFKSRLDTIVRHDDDDADAIKESNINKLM